jgi:hypothetical protein
MALGGLNIRLDILGKKKGIEKTKIQGVKK